MSDSMEAWFLKHQRIIGGSLLGVFVFIGIWIRVNDLYHDSLWIDEGFTIMQQRAITEHGYPLLRSGNIEFKDLVHPYVLTAFKLIRPESSLSFRWVSVFFGGAGILMMYGLSKRLFGSRAALLSAFFITFSYWHIAWSRQIRSYTMAVFFILLALYFFSRYATSNQKKDLYGLGLATLLLVGAKSGIGILFVGTLGIVFLLKRQYYYWLIAGMATILFGMVFHSKIFLLGKDALPNNLNYYIIGYFIRYYGLLFFVSIVGFGMAFRWDRQNREFHMFAGLVGVVSVLFFSFFHAITQGRYLFALTPLLFLYGSYSIIYGVSRVISQKRIVLLTTMGFIILLVVVDSVSAKTFLFFTRSHFPLEFYTPQPNYHQGYAYIHKMEQGHCTLVSAYPYLEEIYLGKAGYALPISYTGKQAEPSLTKATEYYTNVPRILTPTQLTELQQQKPICVLLDTMAMENVPSALIEGITEAGTLLWLDESDPEHAAYLYKL